MFFTGNRIVIAANLTFQRELNLFREKGKKISETDEKTTRKWCCNSTRLSRTFNTTALIILEICCNYTRVMMCGLILLVEMLMRRGTRARTWFLLALVAGASPQAFAGPWSSILPLVPSTLRIIHLTLVRLCLPHRAREEEWAMICPKRFLANYA